MVSRSATMRGQSPDKKEWETKKEKPRTYSPNDPTTLSLLKNIVVIVGATLTVLVAFRNSLTWHLQRFWGASGDFWQAQWDKILDTFGEDPYTYYVNGGLIITFIIYWIIGSIFTILDVTVKPTVLRKYKVQLGTNEPVDKNKLLNAIMWVIINQTAVAFPFIYMFFKLMEWRGLAPLRELPTFHWVLVEFAVFIVIQETLFYYSHRLLHNRYLYRFIHKKHHEWISPIAITAEYCHPFEHVFSNLFSVLCGPFVMKSHVVTEYLWATVAIAFTLVAHSGYHLPFLISPEDHDFHHQKFNACFGTLGVLDRLHGTDASFRKNVAHKRHVTLLTLKSAREIHPDKEKK